MLTLHCNSNDKKKNIKKKIKIEKIMRFSRFGPKINDFKVHQGIHYAKNAKNNQYMLKL